jgi:hypothetical protein
MRLERGSRRLLRSLTGWGERCSSGELARTPVGGGSRRWGLRSDSCGGARLWPTPLAGAAVSNVAARAPCGAGDHAGDAQHEQP